MWGLSLLCFQVWSALFSSLQTVRNHMQTDRQSYSLQKKKKIFFLFSVSFNFWKLLEFFVLFLGCLFGIYIMGCKKKKKKEEQYIYPVSGGCGGYHTPWI